MQQPKFDGIHQGKQVVTVLGATGSIGSSTLNVLLQHPEHFEVFAVTACQNWEQMLDICERVKPRYAVMSDSYSATQLRGVVSELGLKTEVLSGASELELVATAPEVTTVMAAIVGAAGLTPTLAAVKAGKRVLLANKEALVMSGQLFMQAAHQSGAQILPVDSEHNAIFQALPTAVQQSFGTAKLSKFGVEKILLTGSGGPFRELPLAQLEKQTPEAACKHPNWSMGQKISVDSATHVK